MPLFCRHNRFEASCPICSRENAPAPRARAASPRRPGSAAKTSGRRTGGLVTKKLARAADDGYRHALVPGVKATADAERLAAALAIGAARLELPGPHPAVAERSDEREAVELAFLLALAGPADAQRHAEIVAGDRSGAEVLHEHREVSIAGEPGWTPRRRFARAFDRLRLPGLGRAERFELLVILGAAGVYELEADALHVAVSRDDATTLAAKRALASGDSLLLERRAAALADAAKVPVGALDRGLALWDGPQPLAAPSHATIRSALGLP